MSSFIPKKVLKKALLLPIACIIAIGRIYEERLAVGGINISVLISILYFIALIILFSKKVKRLTKHKFLIFSLLTIFSLYLILHSLFFFITGNYNQNLDYSINKFIDYFTISLPLCLFFLFYSDIDDIKELWSNLFIVSIVFVILGGLVLVNNGGVPEGESGQRLSVLGGGPIVYSRWLLFGVLFSFYLLRNVAIKIIYPIIALILSLLSGSKGPLFMLVFSFIIYSLFVGGRQKYIYIFIVSVFIYLFSSNIEQIQTLASEFEITPIVRILSVFNENELSGEGTTQDRINLNSAAWIIFSQNLFGIGIGNFFIFAQANMPYLIPKGDYYPHNLLLEIGCELGVIPLVAFIIILAMTFLKLIKNSLNADNKNKALNRFLLLYLIFIFLNSMTSGDLSAARQIFLIIGMASSS